MTKQILRSQITAKDIARFWSHVDKSDECWIWTGSYTEKGYGHFSTGGRFHSIHWKAHRFSWQIHHGTIPDGLCVLHRCDNPPCVNPDHLFLGTQADNTHDMMSKGRWIFQQHPERQPRGERHGQSKLTAEQVIEIRRQFAMGTDRNLLAKQFGISLSQIYRIAGHEWWKHVK